MGILYMGFITHVCLDEAVNYPYVSAKLSPPPHRPLWPPIWVRRLILQATGVYAEAQWACGFLWVSKGEGRAATIDYVTPITHL